MDPRPRGRRGGTPQSACAPRARHAGAGGEGGTPNQEGGGGGTPRVGAHALCARHDKGDGGGQYQQSPPTSGRSGREGATGEQLTAQGTREGAPPSLGVRGAPEEQNRAIVAGIIIRPPGGGPHSGQALEPTQQAQQTRGARGRGSMSRSGRGRGRGVRREAGGRVSRSPPRNRSREQRWECNEAIERGDKAEPEAEEEVMEEEEGGK